MSRKLVNWEIDVRTKEAIEESLKQICKLKCVGVKTAGFLVDSGYSDIHQLSLAKEDDLEKIKNTLRIENKKIEKGLVCDTKDK